MSDNIETKIENNKDSIFIPGSLGFHLNSFSPEHLREELKKKQPLARVGMQKYLAIESIPHSYLVGLASFDGITLPEFIEICKKKNIQLETESLSDVTDELKSYSLITERDKKFYATKIASYILKKARLIED